MLAPHEVSVANAQHPGLGDVINKALSVGIPGVTWQTILLAIITKGAPYVLQWLQGLLQQQGGQPAPAPNPSPAPAP